MAGLWKECSNSKGGNVRTFSKPQKILETNISKHLTFGYPGTKAQSLADGRPLRSQSPDGYGFLDSRETYDRFPGRTDSRILHELAPCWPEDGASDAELPQESETKQTKKAKRWNTAQNNRAMLGRWLLQAMGFAGNAKRLFQFLDAGDHARGFLTMEDLDPAAVRAQRRAERLA